MVTIDQAQTTAKRQTQRGSGAATLPQGGYHYISGLDIGNGYVKGVIEMAGDASGVSLDVIDMPSAATCLLKSNDVPESSEKAVEVLDDDYYNNVDVVFNSPLVKDTHRRLLGKRATTARGVLDQFDLVGHRSKADQELSKVLVLGIVAAKTLRDYVREHGNLPTVTDGGPAALQAHVTLALALPINEYARHRESYAAQFLGGTTSPGNRAVHTAIISNFEIPVTIQIIFDHVVVVPEGASAQYAIGAGGETLMSGLLADVRSKGMALEGVTAVDVLAATNTIGIDIGEGTVNFPVFTDGKFNKDSSRTFDRGWGSVLEGSLVSMDDDRVAHSFPSRKQLAEYMLKGPSSLKRGFYEKVAFYVDQEAAFFVEQVADQFARVLTDVGAITEVAYVYGGGSGPLRSRLHEVLLAKAVEMNSEDAFPVMYLDSLYSRKLNREGLMIAARTTASKHIG